MRLPAGEEFSAGPPPSGSGGPQFPKHSRLATAVVLLATAVLFLLPIGREAARTVTASWRGFVASDGDRRNLQRIAAKAEQDKDARELAFVALTYPDGERAMQFADRAVALDPNLVWIYAIRYNRRDGRDWSKSAEWLTQLKRSDPDKTYVYMVSTYGEGERQIKKISGDLSGTAEGIGKVLGVDGEWMKEMDQALRAPNYDSYFGRHEELAREGWKKTPNLSPSLIAMSLWAHSIPDASQIQAYADLRVQEALRAGSAGKVRQAESALGEITNLGKRMTAGGSTLFDRGIGLGVTQRGLEGFEKLYSAKGEANEVKQIDGQLREVEASKREQVHFYVGWMSDLIRGLRWKAVAVQASAILSLILAVAIALSLLVLEAGAAFGCKKSGVGRWIACRVADYGPALFLVSGAIFLCSFRPMAEVFERYRSAELPNLESVGLFWELFALGDANPVSYFYEPYHQWLVVTVALAALAVIVVARGLVRRKKALA
ncbi:MAG: hypothetical protein WAK48_20220 [Candidatus Acidiferrum sp.]